MNRTEFLAALSLRLQDISAEERDEAVKYYSEYLDEVGPEREDAVIAELGGAEKVSNIIRANCGLGPLPKQPPQHSTAQPQLTLDPPVYTPGASASDSAAPQPPVGEGAPVTAQTPPTDDAQPADSGAAAAGFGGTPYAANSGAPYAQPGAYNARNNRILWIVIVVLTFPIWIGLLGGVFGVLFGLIGALFGFFGSGLGVIVGSVINFFAGVGMLGTALADGLATMGFSLLLTALGLALLASAVWLLTKAVPCLWKLIGSLIQWVMRKVGR